MTQPGDGALTFHLGDVKALPHTLSKTRHLTLKLTACDDAAATATFELHNPEAQPDAMVAALIEQNAENVEATNGWRDKLHVPEKAVPVDTSTMTVETLHCRLHERLQVGDRVWTVASVAADAVTLTPGEDHEARTFMNEVRDTEFGPGATAIAEGLGTVDRDL